MPNPKGDQKRKSKRRGVRAQNAGAAVFLKDSLAERLRDQIMQGRLTPGTRIVESYWAQQFGVAQISVREAINLLIADGFVTKATGRSARVVHFSQEDVAQIYELRAALEGLAAGLAARKKVDLSRLRSAIADMRRAVGQGKTRELLSADLEFHLELCRLGGNQQLLAHARSLLLPLFAFISMRAAQVRADAHAWQEDLVRHERILDVILAGDPLAAEFSVRAVLRQFAERAHDIWVDTH